MPGEPLPGLGHQLLPRLVIGSENAQAEADRQQRVLAGQGFKVVPLRFLEEALRVAKGTADNDNSGT